MAHNPNVASEGKSPGQQRRFSYVETLKASHAAANNVFLYPVSCNSPPGLPIR
jgi:hypothetical protein